MDLSGGMGSDREYFFDSCPAQEGMRDAINMWVSDDRGVIGLPRFAIEAVAPDYDTHMLSLNIAFPDGRVYIVRDYGVAHKTTDEQGKASILGAGPLRFQCVSPFKEWHVSFKGKAEPMTTAAQMHGALPHERLSEEADEGLLVDVSFDLEATMAVPPWIQGTMSSAAADILNGQEGSFMGGDRFEQLFRVVGRVQIDTELHEFFGSGLRIRRQGVRNVQDFWGHCWQSALFPSGRAFGYNAYPPREDGKPTYNEGFIYLGHGELIPARVIKAPWLSKLSPNGDDVSCVLETANGEVHIHGETFVSTFAMGRPNMPPNFPVLQQTGVRYRWDGEESYGMMERSSRKDKVSY
ncbi:hypothetical protein [Zhongshania aquimaris]|uniref:6-phosphofructokinase n=1 Tax=Zhongshania aquimaris TaxID=2857107 RepID=A0ABS6VWL7_9GAMM|nr:hypothetical protein [Zhongshania aquimaris]MBW2942767.1 hypothetical protein [Zhongshania aquimaris]